VTDDPLVALAERLQDICVLRGITVGTAESCTGGLIAHVLTEVPGSSGYFVGGIVSYSNEIKERDLGVAADVIARHGAVSAQTARAMATGARLRLGVDVAVSVTGIAGPGGGSDEKPIGLTYIGIADRDGVDVRRYAWTGDRTANKRSSAAAALTLMIERLEDDGE
jgi:PncC family amidohydrolase